MKGYGINNIYERQLNKHVYHPLSHESTAGHTVAMYDFAGKNQVRSIPFTRKI